MSNAPLAIVAGDGELPRLLVEECRHIGRSYVVLLFAGFMPPWAVNSPTLKVEFEQPARMFKALKQGGFAHVTFAGRMQRPGLRPLKFDWKFLTLAPTLLPALKSGDDVTLGVITAIFEAEGIHVLGAHDVLATLLAPPGTLTTSTVSQDDWSDIRRGFDIARAAGRVDAGQGAVVAHGICLAVESIQGTDAMLRFVQETGDAYGLDDQNGRGVLCKAPKPGQDWRVDLPAIGPCTFEAVARAGLAGVAVEAGGVLILDREGTVAKANELGLFLVGVAPEGEVGV